MAGMQKKKPCKYASKCYRRNPQHLEEYSHPEEQEEETSANDEATAPAKKKPKLEKKVTPQKKRATIEDYFKKKKENDTDKAAKTEEESRGAGNTSGYVRASPSKTSDSAGAKDAEDEKDECEEEEELDAPDSPTDEKENIKSKFLVEMPEDFYQFWDFAKSVNASDPTNAFKKSLNLQLVGPFDVLAGKCVKRNSLGRRPVYLRHWRYYFDPPEFLTVLRGDDVSQFHIGYFRDDPREMPGFAASNAAKENATITPRGENLFAAVNWYMEDVTKREGKKDRLDKLKNDLRKYADKHNISLQLKTDRMRAREKKVCSRTFHGAGMVVPVDKNEIGYRELPETTGALKKMFQKIKDAKTDTERDKALDPLMEIIMLVQFANDESDYGEGLELGLDLFSFGGNVLHKTILNLLPLAYQLLGRNEYKTVIEAHLKDRKHSANLSQLD